MIVLAVTKYSDSSSRISSGSRDSERVVKPTRSQKSTEHSRRSDTRSEGAGATSPTGTGAATGCAVTASTGEPQSPQKVESASRAAEQTAHVDVSGEPQERQNRLPSVLSVSHTAQIATASEYATA